ncbi:MAG: hypothetical protein ABIK07_00580 [Planctomycetota bacterium]
MKTVSLILVLLLVFLLVPGDIAKSNDKPYKPLLKREVNDGDDHPWGGDSRSGGGIITTRELPPRVSLGVVMLDYIFRVPLLHEYEVVVARQIEGKQSPRSARQGNSQDVSVQRAGSSTSKNEGVNR